MDEAQPVSQASPLPPSAVFPSRLTFPRGHFPRLAECAHFHYETVDFGNVQVSPETHARTRATAGFSAQFSTTRSSLCALFMGHFHQKDELNVRRLVPLS